MTENDLTINLGAIVQATDFDGDSVTGNATGLVITVDDDTPIATAGTSTGTVDEDGVVEGVADAGPGDGIAGGTGDVAGDGRRLRPARWRRCSSLARTSR